MTKNKDARPVSTDALETLGLLNHGKTMERDAIHLAVEPVTSLETLYAGQHVGFDTDGNISAKALVKVGIVDPFIKEPVFPGMPFWLVVYPRTIQSLRHVWSHPSFLEEASATVEKPVYTPEVSHQESIVEDAIQWVKDYCSSIPLGYDMMMNSADYWLSDKKNGGWGEYLVLGGLLEGEYVPDSFWDMYEIIRDVKVPSEHRGSFFSCSC